MSYTIPSSVISPGAVYQPRQIPAVISQNARALYYTRGGATSGSLLLDQSPLNSGTRRTGEEGRCVGLNGTNQAVRVADNAALDITDNLSVMAWVKNDNSTTTGEYVLTKYDTGANKREWALGYNSSQKLFANIGSSDGSAFTSQTSDAAVSIDSWNHVAFTFSAGSVALYVNGSLVASTASASHPASLNNEDADLIIGAGLLNNTTLSFFDGQILDARIYAGDSTVLTAAQIAAIYADGPNNIQFTGQTLRAHYKLDEQSGSTCYDSSGNSNNGTIENAVSNWGVTQDIWSFQNQVGYSDGVNLIYHSEDITNVVWAFANTGTSRIANQTIAPDGTLTADLLREDNAASEHRMWYYKNDLTNSPFVIGENYVYSICLKANGRNTIRIGYSGLFSAEIDLSSGTTSYGTLTSLGDGWYRFVGIFSATIASVFSMIHRLTNPAGTMVYTGDGVSGIYFWGAQVQKTQFTYYQKTTSEINFGKLLPRDESDPTNDVLGNPLTNIGRRPNDAALHSSNCLTADGILYIAAAHLAGTETVVSSGGTSTPSISAGRIDFTAGTCWDLTLSDGTHYPLSEGGGIGIHDDSGAENHGILTNAVLANAWGGSQNSYHSNLSDGFVYAYQPAKQVFTAAQAANITGISFKFRSTDTRLKVFYDGGVSPFLLALISGSADTNYLVDAGSPLVNINGVSSWGTTRGDLFNALCDGNVNLVAITGLSFSGDWLLNGIFVGGTGTDIWDSSTYLWDLVATDSNGDPIYPAAPDVRLPAVTSSLGPYSIPLTDLPSNGYHNRAETLIDLDPDSTPEMGDSQLGITVPASHAFGDAWAASDQIFSRQRTLTEDRFVVMPEAQTGSALATIQKYTQP